MNKFFDEEIFLDNGISKELYKEVKDLPIFDYHCHLSPKEIAEDRVFHNIGELWLEGDHYKWRLMRANGTDEGYITGNESWHDKFIQFAKAVENAPGNPVYHWIHFELKFYFGITETLCEETAEEIWEKTSKMMEDGSYRAKKLIKKSNVKAVFTTDDPADSLEFHEEIAKQNPGFSVFPTFRPDKAVCGIASEEFPYYLARLEKLYGKKIKNIYDMCNILDSRVKFFASKGCRASDISLSVLPKKIGTVDEANSAFAKALYKEKLTQEEVSEYVSYMFVFLANKYSENGMAMQLHLSALRNNDKNLLSKAGVDCGNDSVGKAADIDHFSALLNAVCKSGKLPKTIVYTLNPSNYYELATMLGNFWGENSGTIQLGAAWWFNDHRNGIRKQLETVSETGLLGKFNGMLTDSRSFTSYTRHDYFRRILCSYLGELVENGEFGFEQSVKLAKNISYYNASKYFDLI